MFEDFNETEPKSNTVYLLYLKILKIPREGWGERKLPGKFFFENLGIHRRLSSSLEILENALLFHSPLEVAENSNQTFRLNKKRPVSRPFSPSHFPLRAILHGEGAVWERGSVGIVLFSQQPAKSGWACSSQTDYCTCDDIRGLNGIKGTRGGNGGNAGTPGEIYH